MQHWAQTYSLIELSGAELPNHVMEEVGARVIGTPLLCSQGRGDEVRQDTEDFVGKQNSQAASLSAAPAPEQSPLRTADLYGVVCTPSICCSCFLSCIVCFIHTVLLI